MPDDVVLLAAPRAERGSRPAGRLRRAGRVPAVVYGLGNESVPVTVDARELGHILAHGVNTVVSLDVAGDRQMTLVRQIQRHPTRGDLVHVDFVRVRADIAVTADVALHLEGEPEGVRNGGRLEQVVFQLPVEAKPQDIPESIVLDVTHLAVGDQVRVADLSLPAGVVSMLDEDALVAHVAIPRGVSAGEGEEGAEGEEGEAAASAEGASDSGSGDASDEAGGE